jgi:uncharacterized ferritin-like protein (DUF455 family)
MAMVFSSMSSVSDILGFYNECMSQSYSVKRVLTCHRRNQLHGGLKPALYDPAICPRALALQALQIQDPQQKTAATLALARIARRSAAWRLSTAMAEPQGLPGMPANLSLVHAKDLRPQPLHTPQGKGALLHALAHIELNAVNLALDAVWRFADMPLAYYLQWLDVARDEAYHYRMLARRMAHWGTHYTAHAAHNTLWDMAHKTRGDVLARMALVPRLHEARGLDAAPAVREKLIGCGDAPSGAVVAVIQRDEVGHVAVGNHWFRALCQQRGLDPIAHYTALCQQYDAPKLRPPFNEAARLAAGFTQDEIDWLYEG